MYHRLDYGHMENTTHMVQAKGVDPCPLMDGSQESKRTLTSFSSSLSLGNSVALNLAFRNLRSDTQEVQDSLVEKVEVISTQKSNRHFIRRSHSLEPCLQSPES